MPRGYFMRLILIRTYSTALPLSAPSLFCTPSPGAAPLAPASCLGGRYIVGCRCLAAFERGYARYQVRTRCLLEQAVLLSPLLEQRAGDDVWVFSHSSLRSLSVALCSSVCCFAFDRLRLRLPLFAPSLFALPHPRPGRCTPGPCKRGGMCLEALRRMPRDVLIIVAKGCQVV